MESLEDRQREMKKRNARKQRREGLALPEATLNDSPEVLGLKKKISALRSANVCTLVRGFGDPRLRALRRWSV
jgi:hypothetical protein